jgi:large subunit ribosomal protein L14
MIQSGTYLNVIDNSGAKKCICIQVKTGYKQKYSYIGDLITVSVKKLRSKRRNLSKVKKGQIYKALIVKTKKVKSFFNGDTTSFLENCIILLNNKNKIVGTRIFGSLPKDLRYTKYLKILSLCSGKIA